MKIKYPLTFAQYNRLLTVLPEQRLFNQIGNFGKVPMNNIVSFNQATTEYNEIVDSANAATSTSAPNPPPAGTWTFATNSTSANNEFFTSNGTAIAFGNNKWVALGVDDVGGVSTPKIYYSSNGTSWTLSSFNGVWSPGSVKYVNGLFCIIGGDGGRMRIDTSLDGNTWTNIPGNGGDVFQTDNGVINDVIHDGTYWIVAGDGFVQLYYSGSIDPASAAWNTVTTLDFNPVGAAASVRSIVYTGTRYVVTGTNTKNPGQNIAYLDDPIPTATTWTSLTAFDEFPSASNGGILVLYDSSVTPPFIAIGNINTIILTSTDGGAWSTIIPPNGGTTVFNAVLAGEINNRNWFVISEGGVNSVFKITGLTTSINYPVFNPTNSSGRYLAYGNGKLWAVGVVFDIGGQNAYYSTDGGSTWVAASVQDAMNPITVIFGGGKFVTTGSTITNKNIQYTT